MSQDTDLAQAGELAMHRYEVILFPRLWQTFAGAGHPHLSWTVSPFADSSKELIPDQPGVYAFMISPGIAGDLHVAYLMYVGKTDRTLRQRFAEYLREAASDSIRPKLLRLLRQYPAHLHFACAAVPGEGQPEKMESALLSAFVPPANDQLPADISRARKAF